mgnify:CR=1 FL=1
MITDLNEILVEWAYRTNDGKPDVKSNAKLLTLEGVLKDFGWSREARAELLSTLMEADIVKNKDSGNIYTVQKHNPNTQDIVKKNASDADIAKVTKDKVDKEKSKEKPNDEEGVIGGDLSDGDNQVKSDMFKYGYKNFQKNTGTKPAPGGAGSAFNEIMSGEGVHILEKNPDMTEEELVREMYNKTKDTELGKEQKRTTGIGKIPKDVDNPELYSKCVVSARSAIKKRKNTLQRVKSLQNNGKFGEPQKTSTYYGAQSSIDAQVEMVENSSKALLPNGQEVKKEDVITFIKAGGGGMNPSDTATFVTDEKGNLLVQFHSDKTTTADIQDNSTLIQEGENYKGYIEKSDLSEEKKKEASSIVDDISKQISDIEENYNDQATPIAKRLSELPIENQVDIIENDKGTLKKNLDVAVFGEKAFQSDDYSKVGKKYLDYLPDGVNPKDLNTEQKLEMVRKAVSDGVGKGNDTKVINKIGLELQKQDSSIEGIDVKKNLSNQREKVVGLQRDRVKKLNELENGLGTKMEANEAERAFHLKMLDYPPKKYEEGKPDSIMGTALDVNMGGNEVNGKVLRNCLGVDSTKDFKDKFRLLEEEKITKDDAGNVTGKVVFVYALGDDDKRVDIGFKTYRSKAGAAGKTNNTMAYSTSMQNCFKTGEKP